ncbi:putative sodium-coupled neutral amino acid transporter 7 [Dissostichus eleginoides]|uniref:Sodium-coupled neutral amino acid transporter 7 n=1 Tax=Dissostichus eleginoides TaxID=100907 RepID=A0AAD9FAL7_DISEL|nr:putative sodium-coupled neutral amino acid transporter 7 [Dissostichus eleginoides]
MAINTDVEDWAGVGSHDSGERAWLLQSPSVESVRVLETESRGGGVSSWAAVFIVVNAALGAGLLNFPAAFNMAGGVTAGVMLQMFMLIFIISGLVILGYCCQVSNESTYQEVVRATCGKFTGILCEVAIAIYTFGTCIAFFIVIGDQLDRLVAAVVHDKDGSVSGAWYTDRKFTISVTAVLIILPLSIPKEIGFQKYASALSVMGTWYVTIVVIIKYIGRIKRRSQSTFPPVLLPGLQFSMQCPPYALASSATMSKKAIKPWGVVVTFSMIICLFVYTGTGVCGFLTFGSNVNQDVLMSYPSDDIAVAIARAFIVICVITSYPILHFCGRAVIEGLWLRFQGEQVELCVRREQRRRILQTLVWFTITLTLALFIPDIGRVISLIGGLAACFIFVFPGLCLMQAKLSETDSRTTSWHGMVVFGIIMVTIGTFIFGLTTTNSIYQDVIS